MPYLDKEKNRKYQRDFLYKKKKDNPRWHAELKKNQKRRRETNQDIVIQIKKHLGCLLCEENDTDKLQFHHVLHEFKTATVSELLSNRSKLIAVIKEIDKCVCVCSACHKKLEISIDFLKATLISDRWAQDWGVVEALDWSHCHPQLRLKKGNFLEVIKSVLRNCQMHDEKKFCRLVTNLSGR